MSFDLVYVSELERVLKEKRSVLIDVRMREDYLKDHWPGAVNYSYGDIAGECAASEKPPDHPVLRTRREQYAACAFPRKRGLPRGDGCRGI